MQSYLAGLSALRSFLFAKMKPKFMIVNFDCIRPVNVTVIVRYVMRSINQINLFGKSSYHAVRQKTVKLAAYGHINTIKSQLQYMQKRIVVSYETKVYDCNCIGPVNVIVIVRYVMRSINQSTNFASEVIRHAGAI